MGWSCYCSITEPDTLRAELGLQFLLNVVLWFPVGPERWLLLSLLWSCCYLRICVGSLPWAEGKEVEYKTALGAQAKYLLFSEYRRTRASLLFEWVFCFRSAVKRLNGFLFALCGTVIVILFLSFPMALESSFLLFAEVLISGLH